MGRELGKWDKVQGRDSQGCKMIKMINYMFWVKQVGVGPRLGCKTRKNSNFLKNGKMVISVKIQNFSRSRMMKRISQLESSRQI